MAWHINATSPVKDDSGWRKTCPATRMTGWDCWHTCFTISLRADIQTRRFCENKQRYCACIKQRLCWVRGVGGCVKRFQHGSIFYTWEDAQHKTQGVWSNQSHREHKEAFKVPLNIRDKYSSIKMANAPTPPGTHWQSLRSVFSHTKWVLTRLCHLV